MSHQEAKIQSATMWEERKPNRKKAQTPKRPHKQAQDLRVLTQVYSQTGSWSESALHYLEDCWE